MKIPSPIQGRTDPTKQPLGYLDSSASPNAFGAQIGSGISDLGQGINNVALFAKQEAEKNNKIEDFDLARRLTIENGAFAEEVEQIKKAAPPSGVGVRQSVEEKFTERFGKFMQTVPDRAKPEYDYKLAGMKVNTDSNSRQFETVAGREYFKTGVKDEASRAKSAVNQSPDLYDAELARVRETVAKTGLSEIEKAELNREIEQGLAQVLYKKQVANGTFSAANMPLKGAVSVVVDKIFSVESGGKVDAKNPNSSAVGLGQFQKGTWIEQLRIARPDLAQGQPDEFLYGLRLDPKVMRDVTTQYTMQNANELRTAGIAPTPSALYLAHFLGPTGAKRVLAGRDEQPLETVVSSEAMAANKSVFSSMSTVADLKAWSKQKMGDTNLPLISATRTADGYWTVPGIEYDLAGKQRPYAVSKEYVEKVVPAIHAVDPSLTVKVVSGGQEPGEGTGSHRHDVDGKGESGTADLVLVRNGKALSPEKDKEVYAKVLENLAAQGFTGIGHYGWGIHVGGGSRAKWGPDKTGATVDPVYSAAVDRGWARAADGNRDALDTDPRFKSLTFEDRQALRVDGEREARAQATAQVQEQNIVRKQQVDQLYTQLFDGKAGQADIDIARQQGLLGSFEEINKAASILAKRTEEISDEQRGLQKLGTPGAVWDPTGADDKKMLNALIGEKGKNAIGSMNREYFNGVVVPIVERAKDIPSDVVGTLAGMMRSSNPQQVLYAIDALSELQRAQGTAFADRVPSALQNDVTRFNALKNVMPQDELLRTINGGNSQEERQANAMRRKDGEELLAKKSGKVPKLDALVADVVGQYGEWFARDPKLGKTASAMKGMERFAEELWLTEYIKTGNEDAATTVVKEAVKTRYGVTELGGKGKVLMELPPERAGYKPLGGGFDWIDKEIREMIPFKPGEGYELQTDEQTRKELAMHQAGTLGRLPSYGIIKLDENGVPRAGVFDEKGRPKRVWFKPKPADLQKEIDEFDYKNQLSSDTQFRNEYFRALRQQVRTGIPVPAEITDEYNKRKQRRGEIDAARKQKQLDDYRSTTLGFDWPRLSGAPNLVGRLFELEVLTADTFKLKED